MLDDGFGETLLEHNYRILHGVLTLLLLRPPEVQPCPAVPVLPRRSQCFLTTHRGQTTTARLECSVAWHLGSVQAEDANYPGLAGAITSLGT